METGTNMTATTATTSNATSNAPTLPTSSAHNDQPHEFREPVSGAILRGLLIDGEPWFVAKDVAKALGYTSTNMTQIFQAVPAEWKGSNPIATPGGLQSLLTISEQGLYFFLARSDKATALPFQKWLAGEVLPAIRKHGGYLTPAKLEEALSDPDTLIMLATNLKAEREKRRMAEAARAKAEHELEVATPKARTYDAVMAPRKLELLTFCRRFRDVNLNLVRPSLEKAGVIYRKGNGYKVYAAYRDSHFSERTDFLTGRLIITVEPKGQQLLTRFWEDGTLARKKARTAL